MPVVDTSQTFNTGDTVTSTSLNNIMDQSSFVAGAVVTGDGLTVTAGGQMTIENLKVTGSKIGNLEVSTTKIANDAITTAKIADSNVTQAKLAPNVVGNGPAFRAYATAASTINSGVFAQVNLQAESFDTNSNFASSRFTPTVAGYYLFTGTVTFAAQIAGVLAAIYKNGAESSIGAPQASDSLRSNVTDILYMNGSSDYVELRAYQASGIARSTATNGTYLSGCLIRSA